MERVYVGNLPPDIRIKDIDDFFRPFGKLIYIDVNHRANPVYAYVQFDSARNAFNAVKARHGYDYEGYTLQMRLVENEVRRRRDVTPPPPPPPMFNDYSNNNSSNNRINNSSFHTNSNQWSNSNNCSSMDYISNNRSNNQQQQNMSSYSSGGRQNNTSSRSNMLQQYGSSNNNSSRSNMAQDNMNYSNRNMMNYSNSNTNRYDMSQQQQNINNMGWNSNNSNSNNWVVGNNDSWNNVNSNANNNSWNSGNNNSWNSGNNNSWNSSSNNNSWNSGNHNSWINGNNSWNNGNNNSWSNGNNSWNNDNNSWNNANNNNSWSSGNNMNNMGWNSGNNANLDLGNNFNNKTNSYVYNPNNDPYSKSSFEDKYTAGLSGSGRKWFNRYIRKGFTPEMARAKALEHRTAPYLREPSKNIPNPNDPTNAALETIGNTILSLLNTSGNVDNFNNANNMLTGNTNWIGDNFQGPSTSNVRGGADKLPSRNPISRESYLKSLHILRRNRDKRALNPRDRIARRFHSKIVNDYERFEKANAAANPPKAPKTYAEMTVTLRKKKQHLLTSARRLERDPSKRSGPEYRKRMKILINEHGFPEIEARSLAVHPMSKLQSLLAMKAECDRGSSSHKSGGSLSAVVKKKGTNKKNIKDRAYRNDINYLKMYEKHKFSTISPRVRTALRLCLDRIHKHEKEANMPLTKTKFSNLLPKVDAKASTGAKRKNATDSKKTPTKKTPKKDENKNEKKSNENKDDESSQENVEDNENKHKEDVKEENQQNKDGQD